MAVTAKFKTCLKLVRTSEGGDDDDPDDRGGRTSRGITQGEYDRWRKEKGLATRDVWKATNDEVDTIYATKYWDTVRGDDMPLPIAYCMFDGGVLSGPGYSRKLAQRVVGVKQDGILGPISVAALNAVDKTTFVDRYCDLRIAYFEALGQPKFLRGWKNRQAFVRKNAMGMIKLPTVAGEIIPVVPTKKPG